MPELISTLTGKINRRSPRTVSSNKEVWYRQNMVSRDGRLKKVAGTEPAIDTGLTDVCTWLGRYVSYETGVMSPKTFAYTIDGKLWNISETNRTATEIKTGFNLKAYPESRILKYGNQNYMYFIDGVSLFKYDGNNSNVFTTVPISHIGTRLVSLIEHRDRLLVLGDRSLRESKNLDFDVFDDATDSIEIIVGSGKGTCLALRKIEERLYILTTEGVYILDGDTISAVAETFSISLVEERNIISARTAIKVENSIMFLAGEDENIELWSFDGGNSKLLSYSEKITEFINPYKEQLDKAVAIYEDHYYKLSFVQTGATYNNFEVWYDAIEDKIDFVVGRNVSCYMTADTTAEINYSLIGRSDKNTICYANRGINFSGNPIELKLTSKDIILNKGDRARVDDIFVLFEPSGERSVFIRYLLDGRLSDISNTAQFYQDLSGDAATLGFIRINNQSQAMERIKPRIDYSCGISMALELYDNNIDTECSILGIGFNITNKGKIKSKKVGA